MKICIKHNNTAINWLGLTTNCYASTNWQDKVLKTKRKKSFANYTNVHILKKKIN